MVVARTMSVIMLMAMLAMVMPVLVDGVTHCSVFYFQSGLGAAFTRPPVVCGRTTVTPELIDATCSRCQYQKRLETTAGQLAC